MNSKIINPQPLKNFTSRIRSNRPAAVLVFVLIQFILAAALAALLLGVFKFPGETLFAVGLTLLLSLGVTLTGFQFFAPAFLLKDPPGAPPPQETEPACPKQILTALDVASLRRAILQEVLPGLHIRQFAMVRLTEEKQPEPIILLGIKVNELPPNCQIPALIEFGQAAVDPSCADIPTWIRLVIPLYDGKKRLAVWLFGARDANQAYSAGEIAAINIHAAQASLALINIQQANNLRGLYLAEMESHEKEDEKLAIELHDEVLNSLSLMGGSLDPLDTPPMVLKAYQGAIHHIRDMINDLRPSMLNYGLYSGLAALVEEFNNLRLEEIQVFLDIPDTDISYQPQVEMHIYRIVQQAFQNAVQHSCANIIHISGVLEPHALEIEVSDDGVGISGLENIDLSTLLNDHYFGLAGMSERAGLIGATLQIKSQPNRGCRVTITWRPQFTPGE